MWSGTIMPGNATTFSGKIGSVSGMGPNLPATTAGDPSQRT
jgi:hypothetical protein